MAINVGRPRGGPIADINVTPMADVMIVLLIIFMVATPIIAASPVRLPDASHLTQHRGERIEIVVRREGGVEVDGVPLASAELLVGYLGAGAAASGSPVVLIQADQDASYAAVKRVVTACRQARVAEIALAAELRPGSAVR